MGMEAVVLGTSLMVVVALAVVVSLPAWRPVPVPVPPRAAVAQVRSRSAGFPGPRGLGGSLPSKVARPGARAPASPRQESFTTARLWRV